MINRVISVIMSVLISITGTVYSSFNGFIDTLSEMLYGVPYSVEAIKDDFFDDMDDSDVVKIDDNSGFVKDKIVVFLKPDLSFFEKVSFFDSIEGRLVGWCTAADMYVLNYYDMTYDAVTAKCDRLASYDCVELASPVTAYRTDLNRTPTDDFEYPDVYDEWDELNPDGRNWWLEAIDARQAWDYSDYMSKISIGVLDSGFDIDHPDLEGKISFPNEKQANRNSEDNHGCHVAGIIGANHNGYGIAGICDNSELMCVDWYPNGVQYWNTELAIFFGFSTLVQAGAKVVNMSLGSSASKTGNSSGWFEKNVTPKIYSYIMCSLLNKGYDFIYVQSAGNGNYYGDPVDAENNGSFCTINENNIFTGSYDYSSEDILGRIIVVGSATNSYNGKYIQSYFTNLGDTVSIFAPGEDIYSTSISGGYEVMSGTSMSAPIVTAVASLVWSVNEEFTGPEVKDIICSSTDSMASINRSVAYIYGFELKDYPMVNAKLSVEEAIRRSDSTVGTVVGSIIGDAAEIVYDGVSHTIFSDGSYSFVASDGSGIAEIKDKNGKTLGSFDMTVIAGSTCYAGEYIITDNSPATASYAA